MKRPMLRRNSMLLFYNWLAWIGRPQCTGL